MIFTYAINILFINILVVLSVVANRMETAESNSKLKFPYEIQLVDEKTNQELLKYFHGKLKKKNKNK